ncbi:MAG: pyridoxamine 5'-phosphate oxidase family protein [Methanobacterium sp.]|uniref:pyridoxamine 5'-phosphate oxidase family protein n=1 Tax=Methanobacterium sp. TaxID=2164 RepID=UPI003D65A8AC|nr:pyridoxamine 5'-phosphate oxidase family protein [Methanobacterium sp.]
MRRNDKEIKDKSTIERILNDAQVCRIALCNDNKPYIVPMNFGFKDNYIYIHSACEGRKIDIIKENNNVCFEVDIKHELVKSDKTCNWGMKYYSVIGFGKARFINDNNKKKEILNIIMQKYSENTQKTFEYSDSTLNKTALIQIKIEHITGKKSGY